MSFFREERSWEAGAEVAPGVLLERRSFLWASVAVLAGLCGGCVRRGGAGAAAVEECAETVLPWEEFVSETRALAERLVQSTALDEEAYLAEVSRRIGRVARVPELDFKNGGNIRSGRCYSGFPLEIVQFRFEPGAAIPYHDHHGYNGVLMGMEGSLRVRNFEVAGEDKSPHPGKTVEIQETTAVEVTPGTISTLSTVRDNVHDVRAGKVGGRMLDIFTFFRRDGGSSFLDVADKPKHKNGKMYEAIWR